MRTIGPTSTDGGFAHVEPTGTRRLAVARAEGWAVLLADYPGGDGIGWHDHPFDSVHFTVRGESDEDYGRVRRGKRPGVAQFYRAYAPHRTRFGPGGVLVLHVVRADGRGTPAGRMTDRDEAEPDPRALGEMVRELARPDRFSSLAVAALCEEVAAGLGGAPAPRGPAPPWFAGAREAVAQRDGAGSLSAAAGAVGVHPSHLARVFRARLGCTPGAYARRVSLERAAWALAHTSDKIVAIAHDSGFYDQSHFGRAFSRRYGLSPGAFRAAAGCVHRRE